MNAPIDWLLEGEPFIEYRTRRDLLNQPADSQQVSTARKSMLASQPVKNLMTELSKWPGTVLSSHKNAGQLFHKLTFLADLGLTINDPGMEEIVAAILNHQSPEGPFQLPTNIPVHFGGNGQDQWAWALCDAPLTVYAMAKFGLQNHPAIQVASDHLVSLLRDNGWPCAVSKELGKWRGPGRKADPCPFANLAMLKALSEIEPLRDSLACHTGAETLLTLWENSHTEHPYLFYMGTAFRKIKTPCIWYDLNHVLEVLTIFSWLRNDSHLLEMLGVLKSKADPQGRFTVESVWTAWKDWEFGQKKTPSRWLTLLAWRIIRRIEPNMMVSSTTQ